MAIGRTTYARTQRTVGMGILGGSGLLTAFAISTRHADLIVLAILLFLVGLLLVLQSKRI